MFIKEFNNTALVQGDLRISYRELIEHINEYSHIMKNYKKKKVALFCENRIEWVYAFFAAWNIGATLVLIDAMSTQKEVEYILDDSKASLLVTSRGNLALSRRAVKNSRESATILNIDHLKIPKKFTPVKPYTPGEDETILMLYTSGTTGKSKGVMLSRGNIMRNVHWNNDAKRINETDRIIAILPNHHSWPLISTLLCPMECGATTVFLQELTSESLLATLKNEKITMVLGVPRLFIMLHDGVMKKINTSAAARSMLSFCKTLYRLPFNKILGRVKVPHATLDIIPLTRKIFKKVHDEFGGNMKIFISGGAKLDDHIIRDFRAMGLLTVEGYGLTETAPMVTWHPFDDIHVGTVGKVFDEIEVKFEEDGEILLKGPNVTKGYWRKKAETQAAFNNEGFFRTGDLGSMDKERFLTITGRKKDLIILSNGKNVQPDILEETLRSEYSLVEDVAITEKGDKLFAIIVPDREVARQDGVTNISEKIKFDVVDNYNKEVENYKKISDFLITNDEVPRTRMGKLQRFKLEKFIAQHGTKRERKDVKIPSYPEYKRISSYLKEAAGTKVYPDDHIEIDLGLDSLEIVELQLYLEKNFGIKLEEGEMASLAVVSDLAEYVQEKKKSSLNDGSFNWKEILKEPVDFSLPRGIWMMNLANKIFSIFIKKRIHFTHKGVEKIPRGAAIFTPNHTSYLDSIILYNALSKEEKEEIYFFAKEKVFRSAFLRFFSNNAHVIVMDLNHDLIGSLQRTASLLRKGKKIVFFPEGTRSRDGNIQNFKKSFATIAKVLQVPVIPVAISGAYEAMPHTRKIPGKGNVSLEFLDPILPGRLSEDKITEQTHAAISNAVLKKD